jgi:probable F420-dependent oxidoreductase
MTFPAQLSLVLPTFAADDTGDWTAVSDLAVAADRAGIDRVVISEHVAFGENLDAYADPANGGVRNGKQPTGPDGPWLDPLATLAYVAALTSQVQLGTSILIAALRRPVVLAKTAATIDVLSGGRLELGVGVGWQREEYEAAGLSFEKRGRLLDHTIEVCQTLWSEQSASYASDELTFERIHQAPKPKQAGGIPIWVSGTVNKRSMDRLARFGTGWISWGDDAADLPAGIARMRAAMSDRGRAPQSVQVMGRVNTVLDEGQVDLAKTFAPVPALYESGVTDFRIGMRLPTGREATTEFLSEAVAAFRKALG